MKTYCIIKRCTSKFKHVPYNENKLYNKNMYYIENIYSFAVNTINIFIECKENISKARGQTWTFSLYAMKFCMVFTKYEWILFLFYCLHANARFWSHN